MDTILITLSAALSLALWLAGIIGMVRKAQGRRTFRGNGQFARRVKVGGMYGEPEGYFYL